MTDINARAYYKTHHVGRNVNFGCQKSSPVTRRRDPVFERGDCSFVFCKGEPVFVIREETIICLNPDIEKTFQYSKFNMILA